MSDISKEEWKRKSTKTDDAVIIDVRTPKEWQEGIIKGAMTIDIMEGQKFISKIQELDTSKTYFMYCRSGARSGQACSVMQQMGFEKTFNLVGGILGWDEDTVQP